MNLRFATALVLTFLVLAAAILLGSISPMDKWSDLAQAAGTIGALIWVVYTGLYQAEQFQATERATNRELALQSFELVRDELEALTKAIVEELNWLKREQKIVEYETRFSGGERTAYVPLLTGDNGRTLRRLVTLKRDKAKQDNATQDDRARADRLSKRLATYSSTFTSCLDLVSADSSMARVLEGSALGRAFLAIKAASASTNAEAEAYFCRLAEFDTGPYRADDEGIETAAA